jgi:tRNA dimethylallyltransferase
VCGPTACGKSGVADGLAGGVCEASGLEVPSIVVDSMQVYRELPVVTNQYRERPAKLTGIVPVSEEWTVARHGKATEAEIRKAAGPFVLDAGTGMYLNAILLDLDLAPKVPEDLRAEAASRVSEIESSEGANPRREARRVELELAGAEQRGSIWDGGLRYATSLLYVRPPREELDHRIRLRSRRIIRDGAEEVAEVLRRWQELGVEPNGSVKQSVGFKEMALYVTGEASLEWAEEKINTRTRRLARRQMRWFDKLCGSLPEGTEIVVSEGADTDEAASYVNGMIGLWK